VIGTQLSHYRVISHIGAGAMGTVYLAEDTDLKRQVALKFLSPGQVGSSDAAARLIREARAASALDHPHIATIYEIGSHAGQPFIAMAYYEGETLASRIRRGQIPIPEVARIVAQVADALQAAHNAGIVHRDLKPSNVILTSAGQAKVLDFGIAKIETGETATQLTAVGDAVGTLAYMSPEQARGESVDARSDLWALGVVTYEMLTGRRPFEGGSVLGMIQAVTTSIPIPVATARPDTPAELQDLLDQTLVQNRERRTITAGTAREIAAACHAQLSSGHFTLPAPRQTALRIQVAVLVVVLALLASGVVWLFERNARIRWARQEALPEITRLAGDDAFDDAYRLAQQARRYIPGDPLLAEQLRGITRPATIESDPPGAEVFYRPYRSQDGWRPLGKTPVNAVTVPRGLHHWKIELAGYETAEDVAPGPFSNAALLRFTLFPANKAPAGMVRISSRPGSLVGIPMASFEHVPPVALPDYWIDRHEVTNRAFKQFVDDGGYRRADLWPATFVKDGRTVTFADAMKLFRDATGRPGPADWELGTYPAGQDDYPVGGVSWYEAAAYARWAGKSLPTVYHWGRAADLRLSGDVVPASNFGGKSLLPVSPARGLSRAGTTDMAGNIKEWVLNAAGEKRYILGGAWNEPVYMFTDADVQSAFSRQRTYGFRCIKVDTGEDLSPALTAEIKPPVRDPRRAKPVSDTVFNAWRALYSFDHGNLKAEVVSTDDSAAEWRVEKVSYAAGYGDERIPALLFLPKNARPPYQVMIGFSGSNVFSERSSAATTDVDRFSYIMRSGRAFLYPIYKSTFERADAVTSDSPNLSAAYRDHMVMWSKDVGRSVDYLESRPDIAKDKIGFIGLSTGASLAPVFLAIEPRISLGVIYMGGFYLQPSLPEADTVHFAPRVTAPVLMINGVYDHFYPTATSQEPLFTALGTAPQHKKRVTYEAAHNIPRNEMIKEVVNWMDQYWGSPTPQQ
jgi:eukaryotic-like serine/threonine-protein kinase